jgi:hypothetical protein
MKYHQEDMLSQQFYKLDENLKPFAFDILKALYYHTDKGLNIKEIYNELGNKNIVFIRKAITEMDKINLIQIIIIKCDGTEKRYFITKSGKTVVEQQYLAKNVYDKNLT